MNKKKGDEVGRFNKAQFKSIEVGPFECSPALNLIGVHPALIAFAKQALVETRCISINARRGRSLPGDADYDQPFHCDFSVTR